MALAPGLETYPRAFLKPWPAIVVTISLAIFKFFITQFFTALPRTRVHPTAQLVPILWYLDLELLFSRRTLEPVLIAQFVPSSRALTSLDVQNVPGPICVEVLSGILMYPGSCSADKIFLGQRGERIEEFSSPQFAASLSNSEKSMLLKALVVGACSAPPPRFKKWLTSVIGLKSARRETRDD